MPLLSDAADTMAPDQSDADKVSTGADPEPVVFDPKLGTDPEPVVFDPKLGTDPEPVAYDPKLGTGPEPVVFDPKLGTGPQNVIPIGRKTSPLAPPVGSGALPPSVVGPGVSPSPIGVSPSPVAPAEPGPIPAPPNPIPEGEQLPAPDPDHNQFDQADDVAQPDDNNTSTIALSVLGILGVFGGLYVATKKGWL